MIILSANYDVVGSFAQLLTVFLIFIFVLALTYWTTRFAGSYKKQQMAGSNIQVMETVAISAGKYLQIIKVGNQYFLIGIAKDSITYLCELNDEELNFAVGTGSGEAFKIILEKLKRGRQEGNDEEGNN